ncbi:unnamed protein product [Penicillium pancosmium]
MLLQHDADALGNVSVEEIKGFGLALYKVCRLSPPTSFDLSGELSDGGRNDLLTLADLSLSMPDSDELWNAPLGTESELLNKSDSSTVERDNGDAKIVYLKHLPSYMEHEGCGLVATDQNM